MEDSILNNVFKHVPNVKVKNVEGQLLVTISNGQEGHFPEEAIYIINQTGFAIWKHIDGQATLAQIIKKLSEEYNASAQQIEKDALTMIRAFIKNNLITTI